MIDKIIVSLSASQTGLYRVKERLQKMNEFELITDRFYCQITYLNVLQHGRSNAASPRDIVSFLR